MSVRKFLETTKLTGKGGAPCRTCHLERRKEIEKAVREFLAERKAERTFMPWRTFVDGYVKPTFQYPYGDRSLRQHTEKCLGQEVTK